MLHRQVSQAIAVTLTPRGVQQPTEDEEAGEFCNDVRDGVGSYFDIDGGDGDLYVSPDMPALDASEGEKERRPLLFPTAISLGRQPCPGLSSICRRTDHLRL